MTIRIDIMSQLKYGQLIRRAEVPLDRVRVDPAVCDDAASLEAEELQVDFREFRVFGIFDLSLHTAPLYVIFPQRDEDWETLGVELEELPAALRDPIGQLQIGWYWALSDPSGDVVNEGVTEDLTPDGEISVFYSDDVREAVRLWRLLKA